METDAPFTEIKFLTGSVYVDWESDARKIMATAVWSPVEKKPVWSFDAIWKLLSGRK